MELSGGAWKPRDPHFKEIGGICEVSQKVHLKTRYCNRSTLKPPLGNWRPHETWQVLGFITNTEQPRVSEEFIPLLLLGWTRGSWDAAVWVNKLWHPISIQALAFAHFSTCRAGTAQLLRFSCPVCMLSTALLWTQCECYGNILLPPAFQ